MWISQNLCAQTGQVSANCEANHHICVHKITSRMAEPASFFSCSYYSYYGHLWALVNLSKASFWLLEVCFITRAGARAAAVGGKIRWGESTKLRWGVPCGIRLPAAALWGHPQAWARVFHPACPGSSWRVLWCSTEQRAKLWPWVSPSQPGARGAALLHAEPALPNGAVWLFDIPRCPVEQQNR